MTSPSVDGAAEVRAALREILREHGAAGLDDAKLVATLLPDLLAASPREAKLILAASSAGVAGILRTRQAQGMTLPGAMRDAAVVLAQDSMIDAAMCDWIVTEFASSLGYPTTTTSMPSTTLPTTSSPTRSDPTAAERRPSPPTRVVSPYPPPYSGGPPYPAVSPPPFGRPMSYPARPVYQVAPPPIILRPVPPPRRRGGAGLVVLVCVLLALGVCGGGIWYVADQARKAATPNTFAGCLAGTWQAVTSQDAVQLNDGTEVPTRLTGGTITKTFDSRTGRETIDYTRATFTGTYQGKPVTVVYDGSAVLTYGTSGEGSSAKIHVSATTVPLVIKITVNGHTSTQTSVDVSGSDVRADCTPTTLTSYNSDNSVHSTWSKKSGG